MNFSNLIGASLADGKPRLRPHWAERLLGLVTHQSPSRPGHAPESSERLTGALERHLGTWHNMPAATATPCTVQQELPFHNCISPRHVWKEEKNELCGFS